MSKRLCHLLASFSPFSHDTPLPAFLLFAFLRFQFGFFSPHIDSTFLSSSSVETRLQNNFEQDDEALLSIAAAASTAYGAVQKVTRVGRYMYTADGNRFYVKGIAYQTQGLIISGPDNPLDQPSTFVDNLADSAGCVRDLPFLQQLGVNAIRAYSVDSTLNHDLCMAVLSEAGIYVMWVCCLFAVPFSSCVLRRSCVLI
ncbi:Glucanosyltransferase-domain-containing protein [Mycena sanguinolenta]|nr:Glucanosyltransferase-domain-containing protein [Mycena sanguinolenta]